MIDAPAPGTDDFELFYRRERGRVIAVVCSLTGNRHIAEEFAQEAFATAHRKWRRVAAMDRPGDWVLRVALNRAISAHRRGRAESRAMARLGARALDTDARTTNDPDDGIWQAVRRLPARQAQVVALFYVEDLPVERVAAILGLSTGAVKSHLSRARATLATQLAQPAERAVDVDGTRPTTSSTGTSSRPPASATPRTPAAAPPTDHPTTRDGAPSGEDQS